MGGYVIKTFNLIIVNGSRKHKFFPFRSFFASKHMHTLRKRIFVAIDTIIRLGLALSRPF